jgi:two-component system response regulator MprA
MQHIILAEDEADVRSFLQRALEHLYPGRQVTAVADGAEALAHFQRAGADLIVSDYHMPHLTGLELLQAVRRAGDTPVIIITADPTVHEAVQQAGASAVLPKPLTIKQLRDTVYAWLPV